MSGALLEVWGNVLILKVLIFLNLLLSSIILLLFLEQVLPLDPLVVILVFGTFSEVTVAGALFLGVTLQVCVI